MHRRLVGPQLADDSDSRVLAVEADVDLDDRFRGRGLRIRDIQGGGLRTCSDPVETSAARLDCRETGSALQENVDDGGSSRCTNS